MNSALASPLTEKEVETGRGKISKEKKLEKTKLNKSQIWNRPLEAAPTLETRQKKKKRNAQDE
jgi:hypothetical protein